MLALETREPQKQFRRVRVAVAGHLVRKLAITRCSFPLDGDRLRVEPLNGSELAGAARPTAAGAARLG